jgi:hypothetical protein
MTGVRLCWRSESYTTYLTDDAWKITDAIAVAITVTVCPYLEDDCLEDGIGASVLCAGRVDGVSSGSPPSTISCRCEIPWCWMIRRCRSLSMWCSVSEQACCTVIYTTSHLLHAWCMSAGGSQAKIGCTLVEGRGTWRWMNADIGHDRRRVASSRKQLSILSHEVGHHSIIGLYTL